jgi:hypothetical protein
MFDLGILVHLGRRLWSFDSISTSALAGLLALLLLVGTSVSIRHSLQSAFPAQGEADHDLCLLCSFAKGQVTTAEVAPVAAGLLLCVCCLVFFCGLPSFPGFDYRLSPGRAPPAA